ncbi:MAG TPA: HYR domain-containing protein, partial [Candidatus Krumholzibacteria bacterium]|nr:HYR domain-containing protein [Candidatus Krumholzibacteria bacterium]
QPTTLRVQVDCGEAGYLAQLSPVLAAWHDSLGAAFDDTLSLDGAPVWMSESTVEGYLSMLAPVLQQWQGAMNGAFGSAILDSVADYEPGTTSNQDYLSDLSALLATWKGAIELAFARTFLPEVPAFQRDETAPMIACLSDTTIACADSNGVVLAFEVTATDDCDPAPQVVCEPASGSTFLLGETEVTCTATDMYGNSSTCMFTVTVTEAEPPVIVCHADTTLECSGDGATVVEFAVTATSSCSDSVQVVCEPASGSEFPVGETTVKCTATDAFGNSSTCEFKVTVTDSEPPVIENATASPAMLWPPNHKWVNVRVIADAEDACDSTPSCTILGVTSNEAINGTGDGNTEPDWMLTGGATVKLRAERSGNGSSRVYTVHYRCEDGSGNASEGTVDVVVPHDQGGKP